VVTRADASSVLQRVIDPHPVTRIPVWFEHRLELDAIDRSVDGHLPARGQVFLAVSGNRNTVAVPIVDSVASKRMAAPSSSERAYEFPDHRPDASSSSPIARTGRPDSGRAGLADGGVEAPAWQCMSPMWRSAIQR
jgi:hypothetical protein